MKMLKKILISFFAVILVLSLTISGTVIWVINNPEKAWEIAQKNYLPEDLNITWSKIDLSIKHLKGFNFYFNLKIYDFRLQKENPFMDLPADFIWLETLVKPFSSDYKVVAHNWELKASKALRLKLNSEHETEEEKNPFQHFKSLLEEVKSFRSFVLIESILVQIKELRLESNNLDYILISLDADENRSRESEILNYNASVILKNKFELSSGGKIYFNNLNKDQLVLQSNFVFDGPELQAKQEINLDFKNETASFDMKGPINYNSGKTKVSTNIHTELKMSPQSAEIGLDVDILNMPGKQIKIKSLKAQISSPFTTNILWSEKPTTMSLSAPISLYLLNKKMKSQLNKSCQCEVPQVVNSRLNGEIWLSPMFANNSDLKLIADLKFEVDVIKNKLFLLDIKAGLKVNKKLERYYFLPSINTTAHILSFQETIKILAANRILVPAPLDVLGGTIKFQAGGSLTSSLNGHSIPMQATIDLASEDQRVDIQTNANVLLAKNFESANIDLDVDVRNLYLQLPPLAPVQGTPRVISDSRILKSPKTLDKKSTNKFQVNLTYQINTNRPGAIHLLSKYFKPYMPLSIYIKRIRNKKKLTRIRIEPFDIVYLRRRVHLEHMSVDLSKVDQNIFIVDGRLSVKQTLYTVYIDISGTSKNPAILLSSEPYLPRSEIISVLLYDRTSDNLAAADAQTAGALEEAVADRAIGLFGIWAFASTPIKSFSYNPTTKMYTATVELANNVTTSIGTNWEEASQLELSKRVSRNWTVTAAWTPGDDEKGEQTKLILQWERHY